MVLDRSQKHESLTRPKNIAMNFLVLEIAGLHSSCLLDSLREPADTHDGEGGKGEG